MNRPGNRSSSDHSIPGKVSWVTQGSGGGYEVYERDGLYVLSIELPGFTRDDISVWWDDGILVIDAYHEADNPSRVRETEKQYRVGMDIDSSGIQARYQNGILDVFLPPTGNEVSGITIPVED